jgi:hypothetical protein
VEPTLREKNKVTRLRLARELAPAELHNLNKQTPAGEGAIEYDLDPIDK